MSRVGFVGAKNMITILTLVGEQVREMLAFNMISHVTSAIARESRTQTAHFFAPISCNVTIKILQLGNVTLNMSLC